MVLEFLSSLPAKRFIPNYSFGNHDEIASSSRLAGLLAMTSAEICVPFSRYLKQTRLPTPICIGAGVKRRAGHLVHRSRCPGVYRVAVRGGRLVFMRLRQNISTLRNRIS